MDRVFYCWPTGGAVPIHPWAVESSDLAVNHENLFVLCPDHDGLPNADCAEGLAYAVQGERR